MSKPFARKLLSSTVASAVLMGAAGIGTAQAELEFNVGVFTDYILWGTTASDNNAVVQGGVDYAHDSGFYLGTWVSTLGDGDGQEVDLYTGYAFEMSGLDFDIGALYYYYPALDDFDYADIAASVGFGWAYASVNYAAWAQDEDYEGSVVYKVGGDFEVMPSISLNPEIGYTEQNATGPDASWVFWSLGLTKSTDYGDISLTYAQTDESDLDPLFVAGWSTSF